MTVSKAPTRSVPSLAERRRWTTQVEIAEAAAGLFDTQGYDATTVDQIAEQAGIGLRTFYRYCSGKDDVFSGVLARHAEVLAQVLRDAPPSMTLTGFVISAFTGQIRGAETLPLSDRLGEYLTTIPQLRIRLLGAEGMAQERLVPVIAARLGLDEHDLRASVITAVVVAAAATAVEHAASTGRDLEDCLVEAMELVEHGFRP